MIRSLSERLKTILVDSKLITEDQLEAALKMQKEKGDQLSRILVENGLITQENLMILLSEELNIPPIKLSKFKIDQKILKLIPERICRQYRLIPISKIGNVLMIAMADPLNVFALDDIKALTGLQIEIVISTEKDILESINNTYRSDEIGMTKLIKEAEGLEEKGEVRLIEEEKIDMDTLTKESLKAPIVKVVGLILAEALKKRASDIHLEPCLNKLKVRYRVDGALHDALTLPKINQNAILTRLKIMSGLDITENRLPQDGRFKIKLEEKEIDFRVSVLPITYGGKVVLRALDKSNLSVGLEKLGFLSEPLEIFAKSIEKPYGMILVTGPTGSGKSTTLYSIVNKLNTSDRSIITIEDPVEYQLDGITQIQVNPEIGLTFANGLKSLLRQSPDIIMVGEIRDFETADIATKASLTGQLLLSTLHTNDAPGAITRLIDMGVEPFLIASSLILAVAQRLCRRMCPYCKEVYKIPPSVLERAGVKIDELPDKEKTVFYHGRGCAKCNNTGYLGRMGTLEVLPIDDKIREMTIARASAHQIREYAEKNLGMKSLRQNALRKFIMGMTTLEEVLRITSE